MDNDIIVRSIVDKCKIFYHDLLISDEAIIGKYIHFFAKQFHIENRTVNFAFHTGSHCFDMASVAAVMIGCLGYEISSNDEILRTLEIGDMVLFRKERYHWNGIVTKNFNGIPTEYAVLQQDARGMNGPTTTKTPYEKNKHLIKPYFGASQRTDGKGVRKESTNRNDFISYILGISATDVPTSLDVSVVVVADKNLLIDMCKNLRIEYNDGKSVMMTDVVPFSYFTSYGKEIQIGNNQAKAEAVIKATSKISTARELILDKHGNKVIGLLVVGAEMTDPSSSELHDLIRRKSLRFVHIMSSYSARNIETAIEQYDDAGMFACTKELLSSYSHEVKEHNKLTEELKHQINSIVNHSLNTIMVDVDWTWEEYLHIRKNIYRIKQSEQSNDDRDRFIISAMSLLNLFTTSFFSMKTMEMIVSDKRIRSTVLSPEKRLIELDEISQRTPYLKDCYAETISKLLDMYTSIYEESPKGKALEDFFVQHSSEKVALVVPKAYYRDIFDFLYLENDFMHNVDCINTNRFTNDVAYDIVVSVGDIIGKKFDSIECYAAPKVYVLLYDSEGKLFIQRKKKYEKTTKKLNAKIRGLKDEEYLREVSEDIQQDDISEKTVTELTDLDAFVESLGSFDIRKLLNSNSSPTGMSLTSEVRFVGMFRTGEQIMFSKYYSAVVYDQTVGEIKEVSPDKLLPGDILIFTKKNDYTKNIVDIIFDQLYKTNLLDEKAQEASIKVFYWKEVLRDFKRNNDLSFRAVAKELRKLGCSLQEVTIRQWLVDGSHIVGPQDETVMKMIGQLTQDTQIMEDSHGFFEACREIRRYRREILKFIGQAINDKLSNKAPSPGSAFEIVFDNVEKLTEKMELENICELEKTENVNINLVNRPIESSEV